MMNVLQRKWLACYERIRSRPIWDGWSEKASLRKWFLKEPAVQRAGKENFRGGNVGHRSPEARRSLGILGTWKECVWGPAKGEKPAQAQTAENAGTRASKTLLKNLDFILKGTEESLKWFKQGNSISWFLTSLFTYHSRRIWTPDFWPLVRALSITFLRLNY